jgi:chromosome segregation ATPase
MAEIEGSCVPDHWAALGDGTEPLVPNRSCILALECWNFKNQMTKKDFEIEKLKSEICRLKFALKRSMETVSVITPENKELHTRILNINAEFLRSQEELNNERSKTMLQSRVIENHKRSMSKMKDSFDNFHSEAEQLLCARFASL